MFERNIKKYTKPKTRSFFLLILFIVFTTLLVWLFNSPQHRLRSIVSKTHMHIKNINSKFQALDSSEDAIENSASNNAAEDSRSLAIDSTYLELLGFVAEPKLFREISDEEKNSKLAQVFETLNLNMNNNNNNNEVLLSKISLNLPVISTAFFRFGEREKALIESKMTHFLNDLMLVYDLDLSSSEQLRIKKMCNSSCILKPFKGDKYPAHLVNPKMKAYKPIIIQEVLNEYGAVIWIEPPNVFTSSKLDTFLNHSKQNGVLTWSLKQPVSQITHPSMFKYFASKAEDFYFVHTLDTSQLILFNTKLVHEELMLPWVKCALKEECIAPLGSKYYGCDFDRRPLFHYSGCHRYEMSAFSIITSLLFKFQNEKYTVEVGARNASASANTRVDAPFFANLLVLQNKYTSSVINENMGKNEIITTKNLN
jgi:hypothetical protein